MLCPRHGLSQPSLLIAGIPSIHPSTPVSRASPNLSGDVWVILVQPSGTPPKSLDCWLGHYFLPRLLYLHLKSPFLIPSPPGLKLPGLLAVLPSLKPPGPAVPTTMYPRTGSLSWDTATSGNSLQFCLLQPPIATHHPEGTPSLPQPSCSSSVLSGSGLHPWPPPDKSTALLPDLARPQEQDRQLLNQPSAFQTLLLLKWLCLSLTSIYSWRQSSREAVLIITLH